MTINVLAVSGSLRRGSCHSSLIMLAQRLAPAGATVGDPYPIGELPYYDEDLDVDGHEPEAVLAWRRAVAEADGVLYACPEYNYGPTSVMKNAFDWATRPFGRHVMKGKPLAIVGGGGKGGGTNVQEYFARIAPALGCRMANEPPIAIANIRDQVNSDGTVNDESIAEALALRLLALVELIRNPV